MERVFSMPRRAKYHNTLVRIGNYTFQSAAEAQRYTELCLLLKADLISDLVVHPRYILQEAFNRVENGKMIRERAISYVADFAYIENGVKVVEDVKGFETQAFRLKATIFRRIYPQFDFRIIPA